MTNFYDCRAETYVNAVADVVVDVINDMHRNNPRPSYDLSEVAFWSAQAVAPDAGLQRHLEMARLAKGQVLDVIERLRFTVAA
jgi:hypothetical protein